ncbi:MAG TPA: PLP-dependent aminotransferase family protein [Allosphingosinicella sp.]|nr:PLP-dependent aminotransferase family protein [Allosphingosinicella sp.]
MLRPWKQNLAEEISAEGAQPLRTQIIHALIRDIQRGRLVPGGFLPSSRELATMLGVNRKTVVLAYDDLIAQGWLETSGTRGTVVARTLPERLPGQDEARPSPGAEPDFPLSRAAPAPFVLSGSAMLTLDEGSPDSRLFPTEPLARAYRDAMRRARHGNRLGYSDPRGSAVLRESLAAMLRAQRGLVVQPDNLCITRGSQMGVMLAARVLAGAGDAAVMEELSYAPAAAAFAAVGAQILTVPVDQDGMDIDALERLCGAQPVRAIFLTPHHQFPTTVALRPERRLRLIELARAHRFAIIEDDYDHEYHFDSQPLLPVASYAPGSTIYVGSLSKLTLPSLRIGYVVAPSRVIDAIASEIMHLDRQGSVPAEEAVAELVDSGEIRRHARKTHAIYAARMQSFAAALEEHLGGLATFAKPDGGLAFWLSFADPALLDRIDANGPACGIRFAPSTSYAVAPSTRRGLRLGFASLDESEAHKALRRLRAAAEMPV